MAKQRHLRHGDHLEEDDTVVVRGGELDPESLRFDAERYHALGRLRPLAVRGPRCGPR
jgi:hypothetical protein